MNETKVTPTVTTTQKDRFEELLSRVNLQTSPYITDADKPESIQAAREHGINLADFEGAVRISASIASGSTELVTLEVSSNDVQYFLGMNYNVTSLQASYIESVFFKQNDALIGEETLREVSEKLANRYKESYRNLSNLRKDFRKLVPEFRVIKRKTDTATGVSCQSCAMHFPVKGMLDAQVLTLASLADECFTIVDYMKRQGLLGGDLYTANRETHLRRKVILNEIRQFTSTVYRIGRVVREFRQQEDIRQKNISEFDRQKGEIAAYKKRVLQANAKADELLQKKETAL